MNKKVLAAAVAVALSPMVAQAADLSYSYGQINYNDVDVSGGVSDTGFGLEGSFAINEMFHISLDYSSTDFGLFGDLKRTGIGFGYNNSFSDNASFFARAAFETVDVGFGIDDNGYSVEVGVRSMVAENFELQAQIGTIDVFSSSDTVFGIGGRYYFNDDMAVSLEYETFDIGGGIDFLSLGFRFNFGG